MCLWPLSGRGHNSGTLRELNSQNRPHPVQMWPRSGSGRRWPMRWRPRAVSVVELEGYPITTHNHRLYPIVVVVD